VIWIFGFIVLALAPRRATCIRANRSRHARSAGSRACDVVAVADRIAVADGRSRLRAAEHQTGSKQHGIHCTDFRGPGGSSGMRLQAADRQIAMWARWRSSPSSS
jgi:hypothetical protein